MFAPDITRRHLLETGARMAGAAAIGVTLPRSVRAILREEPSARELRSELPSKLALHAIDAAKRSGAAYADVGVTRKVTLSHAGSLSESQELAMGIRALVNGYWGFASGPYWTLEEAERMAREAVAQARVNARGKTRTVELSPRPVATGTWSTPVQTDPFALSYEEITDFQRTWAPEVMQYEYGSPQSYCKLIFQRIEKTNASTDGSLFSQMLYSTGGEFHVYAQGPTQIINLPMAGAGWEYIQEANVFAQIPQLIEKAREQDRVTRKPVDVGRYDVVFDAASMAAVIAATIGPATQLDRALGYEANAGGTSLLNDPLDMLGTRMVATPQATVIADRTMHRGLATVRWDDEGVGAGTFPLLQDGRLVDYQTTREQAAWLAPYYQRLGQTPISRGCANVTSALNIPMQHTPNITLVPGREGIGFDEQVAGVKQGLAIQGMRVHTDFQIRQGSGMGIVREIVNGRLGALVTDAGILFDTEELLKSIKALGGPDSAMSDAFESEKGEPSQACSFTARAVPALITDVAVIDVKRKA